MQATINWGGKAKFTGKTGSGHEIVMDGPPDQGGTNQGPRPMEMMLLGLGACTSFDVMHILQKSRARVTDCQAHLRAQRADSIPSVFTKIHVHFVVSGQSLKESLVRRAIELSAEKYCSASIMLERAGVEITHDYEIKESESHQAAQ